MLFKHNTTHVMTVNQNVTRNLITSVLLWRLLKCTFKRCWLTFFFNCLCLRCCLKKKIYILFFLFFLNLFINYFICLLSLLLLKVVLDVERRLVFIFTVLPWYILPVWLDAKSETSVNLYVIIIIITIQLYDLHNFVCQYTVRGYWARLIILQSLQDEFALMQKDYKT